MGKESDIRTFPFGEQMNKGLYSKIKTQRNTIRKQLSAYSASYPLRNENSSPQKKSFSQGQAFEYRPPVPQGFAKSSHPLISGRRNFFGPYIDVRGVLVVIEPLRTIFRFLLNLLLLSQEKS